MGEAATSDFAPRAEGLGSLRMQAWRSPLLGPEKARVRQPLVILFSFVGDPRECRGDVAFPPSFEPPRRHC